MTQPDALRLAAELEACPSINYKAHATILRQLHEANEAFGKRQEWWNERMFVLEQQRDALLEALKVAVKQNDHDMMMTGEELRQARAALATAEENT